MHIFFQLTTILMFWYLIIWTPYAIVCMYAVFGDSRDVSELWASIPPLACKLGSCVVPAIYYKLFKSFIGSMVNISHIQADQDSK